MERVIEKPVIWKHAKLGWDNANVNRFRMKNQGQTITIFAVENSGLDKILINWPDLFLHEKCQILKFEKKIRVGYVPLQIGGVTGVYLKQHNALSFGRRFASLFVASAAMRSLSGAAVLLQAGFATARPIAAVEYRRHGLLTKSLYLSEEITGAKTGGAFWCENLAALEGVEGYRKRRAFLRKLARLIKSLHDKRIYHNDLKVSNVLVQEERTLTEDPFSLIDLQGLRKCFYVSRRRKIKNLAQLNRTLGVSLTRAEKVYFLGAYGDYRISNRRKKRDFIQRILAETTRQITKGKLRNERAENRFFVETL